MRFFRRMQCILFVFLLLCSVRGSSQSIKKWKIEELTNYIQNSDSVMVVSFWATWCKPCIAELPYFHSITKKYAAEKVKLLLVSLDFPKDYPGRIAAFAKKNNYDAEIVWLNETDADHFCPKVDISWSGAIPATLVYNKTFGFRKFIEGQVKAERLEAELRNSMKLVTYPQVIPDPIGTVNDYEELFSSVQKKELEEMIKDHEQKTTDQIAIVTIKSITPYSNLFLYSLDLTNDWKIGTAEKKNGVAIVFCTSLRQIRIQNGYGIEKMLTDAETQKIIDEQFLPEFRKGNYFEGTKKGLGKIIEELGKGN